MVNETSSPKARILSFMRKTEGPVTGAAMGEALGTSRVAVHKHIERLREAGYAIRSDKRGYLLRDDGDFLYPWELPGREADIDYHDDLPSTMDRAQALGLSFPGRRWIVVAGSQSSGRGRRDRRWESRPGGLFFTIEKPGIGLHGRAESGRARCERASLIHRTAMAASIALCEALKDDASLEIGIHWPNDLYSGGAKIGGILVEIMGSPEAPRSLAIGAGLNVKNKFPDGATSLQKIGVRIDRRIILERFLHRFDELDASEDGLAERWNGHFLGEGLPVVDPEGGSLGFAVGTDDSGRIIVDGKTGRAVYAPSEARVLEKGAAI